MTTMYSQLNCRSHNFKLTFTDTTMTPSSLSVIHYVYLYFSTFHVRRSREGLVVDVPQPSSLTIIAHAIANLIQLSQPNTMNRFPQPTYI